MEWIAVSDKKPEDDRWLIYHAPGIFTTGPQAWIGQYCKEDDVFFCAAGYFGGQEVTHWCYFELPQNHE